MTYVEDGAGSDDGMRECARGDHCAARTTIVGPGNERVVVPAATYRTFCDTDRNKIRACLDELPAYYAELRARIGDRRRSDGPRVSRGTRAASVPINLGYEALIRQIEEIILSWDERVRDLAHLGPLKAVGMTDAVTTACGMLAAHVNALVTLEPQDMARSMDLTRAEYLPSDATGWVYPAGEWILYNSALSGADAGREVLNLHHRCLRLLGYSPQHHDLLTACWECNERALRRHDGSAGLADHVECLQCRVQYLGARLRALMVEEEQAQKRKAEGERQKDARRPVLTPSREGQGGRA